MAENCGSNEDKLSSIIEINGATATGNADSKIVVQSKSKVINPPDGGYGWIIVVASFTAHLIADGFSFSFGILFSELLDVFGESKSKTAWVGSVFVSMPAIFGPVGSVLTNRYGCRKTTIIGGLLAGLGCALSYFAENIGMLCVTFGVISGFGLALVYVPAIVIVAYYFEDRRSFATGIAVAGSGIGTFVFAPLTDFLLEEFGWRGAFLMLSGIMLNLVICGCVYRPLTFSRVTKPKKGTDWQRTDPPRFLLRGHSLNGDCIYSDPITHSLVQFPTYLQEEFENLAPDLVMELVKNDQSLQQLLAQRNLQDQFQITTASSIANDIKEQTDAEATTGGVIVSTGVNSIEHNNDNGNVKKVTLSEVKSAPVRQRQSLARIRHICRKDIFYRGSLLRAAFLMDNEYSASCPDMMDRSIHRQSSSHESVWLKFRKRLQKLCDCSIFRNCIFNYFCLHSTFLFLSYDIPYIYIPDKVQEYGIIDEASFLVSIIGICSTIGQVAMGYLGDLDSINTVYLYNITTGIAGALTMLVPLLRSYPMFAVYCACYGFFISANYALTTVILVELLGVDKLTNAFGFVALAEGLSNLMGPPLAGWLSDRTGSYDATFYLSGAVICLAGLMLFLIPCLEKCVVCDAAKPLDNSSDPAYPISRPDSRTSKVVVGNSMSEPDVSKI